MPQLVSKINTYDTVIIPLSLDLTLPGLRAAPVTCSSVEARMSMMSPTKQWGPIWSGHTWSLRSNSQNNIYYNSSGSFLICGVSSLSLTLFWISKKSLTLILQIDENQNLQELKIKKIWHWLFSSCLPREFTEDWRPRGHRYEATAGQKYQTRIQLHLTVMPHS